MSAPFLTQQQIDAQLAFALAAGLPLGDPVHPACYFDLFTATRDAIGFTCCGGYGEHFEGCGS